MIFAVLAVLAAEADPTVVEARALFEEGRREYEAGHYAEARVWFAHSWDKKQLPELLFNVGQCHFQLAEYDEAITYYERYLSFVPAAHNRALVEDLIVEARTALAAQPPPPTALDNARLALSSVAASSPHGDTPAGAHVDKSAPPAAAEPDDTWLWAGAIAGTIAVVAVGGAVAFALASPTPTLGVIDGRTP